MGEVAMGNRVLSIGDGTIDVMQITAAENRALVERAAKIGDRNEVVAGEVRLALAPHGDDDEVCQPR